jgi:Radical SAM superfamily
VPTDTLRVVILKPSKYGIHGFVERFRRGFMPNSTVPYLRSLTPKEIEGVRLDVHSIDEYVRTDLDYLELLRDDSPTLLALVGVQSHQFHRSLDLAAYARANGVRHCVIGGPHPMTCDTSMLQGRGVSFALAEAEVIWLEILRDAIHGELAPVYGADQRWQRSLDAPVLQPPSARDLKRFVLPMLGIYPARGCPFTCNFCSVIKIAGHRIRSQDLETTMASLRAAKAGGVRMVMFTSDNFNKYPEAGELLHRMIDERLNIPFFVQCDTQIARQDDFVELLGRAGCFQIFVGVESFSRKTLLAAHKGQNHPELYGEIVQLCRQHHVMTHFSNIIGFPSDTPDSIEEHLQVLRGVNPDLASFYILTPVPGTQQYDEFMKDGWITEPNLDRYDATCITWRHPELHPDQLRTLLFSSYRRFYSARHILSTSIDAFKPKAISPGLIPNLAVPVFTRLFVRKKMHPMSGGVGRVHQDAVADYQGLRRKHFGYDLVPLPKSLELSAADARLNQMGKAV